MSITSIPSDGSLKQYYIRLNETQRVHGLEKKKLYFDSLMRLDYVGMKMAKNPTIAIKMMDDRLVEFIDQVDRNQEHGNNDRFSLEKILNYINKHKEQFQYFLNKDPNEDLSIENLRNLNPLGNSTTFSSCGKITTEYENGDIFINYSNGSIERQSKGGSTVEYKDGKVASETKLQDGSIFVKYRNIDLLYKKFFSDGRLEEVSVELKHRKSSNPLIKSYSQLTLK